MFDDKEKNRFFYRCKQFILSHRFVQKPSQILFFGKYVCVMLCDAEISTLKRIENPYGN